MRIVQLKSREIDGKSLVKRSALESDCEEVVSEPGIFVEDGNVVAIYGRFQQRDEPMEWAIQSLHDPETTRTGGLKTRSKIFGFSPRVALRKDFCSATSMATEYPKQHHVICEFGRLLAGIYKECAPVVYEKHLEELKCVKSDWVIPGTPFTSGIVNKTNQLKYHYDNGNFKNVMSCMAVFRKDCEGGLLAVPKYNVKFLLQDHSFFLFDGQSLLHGVTPIKQLTSKAYRYTAVYYALSQMKNCKSCLEEARRIRSVKKEREHKRLKYE